MRLIWFSSIVTDWMNSTCSGEIAWPILVTKTGSANSGFTLYSAFAAAFRALAVAMVAIPQLPFRIAR